MDKEIEIFSENLKEKIELKDFEQGIIRFHLHTKKSIINLINQMVNDRTNQRQGK